MSLPPLPRTVPIAGRDPLALAWDHWLRTLALTVDGVTDRLRTAAPVAFASLPASPVEGMLAVVTDSNTATWGATIAAGGANRVLAYYNGSNWTVAAK